MVACCSQLNERGGEGLPSSGQVGPSHALQSHFQGPLHSVDCRNDVACGSIRRLYTLIATALPPPPSNATLAPPKMGRACRGVQPIWAPTGHRPGHSTTGLIYIKPVASCRALHSFPAGCKSYSVITPKWVMAPLMWVRVLMNLT